MRKNLNRRIEAVNPVKKDHLTLNLLINLIRKEKTFSNDSESSYAEEERTR